MHIKVVSSQTRQHPFLLKIYFLFCIALGIFSTVCVFYDLSHVVRRSGFLKMYFRFVV